MVKKTASLLLVVSFLSASIFQYYPAQADDEMAKTYWNHIFMGNRRVASMNQDGDIYHYHYDIRGNVNAITDQDGNIVQHLEYKPYGELAVAEISGADNLMYRFDGKALDEETGLYYYGKRFYNPALGRWMSADPTVQHSYDPQDLNRYAYCRNNPIIYTDPTGLGWKSIWKKIKNAFIAEIVVFVASFIIMGPAAFAMPSTYIAATAAAVSTTALDTGEGRQLIQRAGHEFFDDVLGMRPKAAHIWSSITMHTLATIGVEMGLSRMIYGPPKPVGPYDKAKDSVPERGVDPYDNQRLPPEGFDKPGSKLMTVKNRGGDALAVTGTRPLQKAPALTHIGAKASNFPVDKVLPVNKPTWGFLATCHQMTNRTFLDAGLSNVVLGQSWDTYLSTFVYGTYGGGTLVKAVTGVKAYEDYD